MLSIPHLIIIFVVALVVFGPEKLPELARNLGKVLGEFRRATGDLRSTFEDHLRDLERETEQRRIGGTAATATAATATATAASTSETPTEPVVTPAEGIVPTMPPHSAVGAPSLGEQVAAPAGAVEPAADPEHSGVQPNTEKER
jgi:sec-independent protein translocase protein TatB